MTHRKEPVFSDPASSILHSVPLGIAEFSLTLRAWHDLRIEFAMKDRMGRGGL